MESLSALLEANCREYRDAAGRPIHCITSRDVGLVAKRSGFSRGEVEISALESNIWPLRLERNRGTLGTRGQRALLRSRVAVLGLGGLGGLASELLVRAGVGKLLLADPDVYEESNLNRQIHSSEENLGTSKLAASERRLRGVCSGVEIESVRPISDVPDGVAKLEGVDLALDCLDTLSDRRILADVCSEADIPMVHAAIAGFTGQLAVIRPGEGILNSLYEGAEENRGIEVETGNLGPTAATLASLEVNEAIKILTGIGRPAYGCLVLIDLSNGSFERVELS
ncbi:MAG: HesA/MoeB/ThiF family protein [Bacillota bacterium]